MPYDYTTLFSKNEVEMLVDADNAITECDLWAWLAEYTPEEGKGFSWSKHPNLDRINKAMKYGGHSGSSYAWTMRQMEYIAKHGFTLYEFKVRQENLAKGFRNLNTVTPNPLEMAEAFRDVPGFEGQADAMKKFAEGKMTYAEMRSMCG